jgi:hypothetical protein
MAIAEYEPDSMTPEEIERVVTTVIASLGNTARDFEHAVQQYNSDFFKGEPGYFQQRLCGALAQHFLPRVNTFWSKTTEQI